MYFPFLKSFPSQQPWGHGWGWCCDGHAFEYAAYLHVSKGTVLGRHYSCVKTGKLGFGLCLLLARGLQLLSLVAGR